MSITTYDSHYLHSTSLRINLPPVSYGVDFRLPTLLRSVPSSVPFLTRYLLNRSRLRDSHDRGLSSGLKISPPTHPGVSFRSGLVHPGSSEEHCRPPPVSSNLRLRLLYWRMVYQTDDPPPPPAPHVPLPGPSTHFFDNVLSSISVTRDPSTPSPVSTLRKISIFDRSERI